MRTVKIGRHQEQEHKLNVLAGLIAAAPHPPWAAARTLATAESKVTSQSPVHKGNQATYES